LRFSQKLWFEGELFALQTEPGYRPTDKSAGVKISYRNRKLELVLEQPLHNHSQPKLLGHSQPKLLVHMRKLELQPQQERSQLVEPSCKR
jgi:hypothetical protein